MHKKMLGIALTGMSLVAMSLTATSSQADTPEEFQAAADIPCWTSFNPSAPQGGPMTHYYKNCNPNGITVTTGRVDAAGQISVRPEECRWVPAGASTSWSYGDTLPNVNYKTIICVY